MWKTYTILEHANIEACSFLSWIEFLITTLLLTSLERIWSLLSYYCFNLRNLFSLEPKKSSSGTVSCWAVVHQLHAFHVVTVTSQCCRHEIHQNHYDFCLLCCRFRPHLHEQKCEVIQNEYPSRFSERLGYPRYGFASEVILSNIFFIFISILLWFSILSHSNNSTCHIS